jgi:hypothetical protein
LDGKELLILLVGAEIAIYVTLDVFKSEILQTELREALECIFESQKGLLDTQALMLGIDVMSFNKLAKDF